MPQFMPVEDFAIKIFCGIDEMKDTVKAKPKFTYTTNLKRYHI